MDAPDRVKSGRKDQNRCQVPKCNQRARPDLVGEPHPERSHTGAPFVIEAFSRAMREMPQRRAVCKLGPLRSRISRL